MGEGRRGRGRSGARIGVVRGRCCGGQGEPLWPRSAGMGDADGGVRTDVRSRKMNENGTPTGGGGSLGQKDPSEPAGWGGGHSALTPAAAFGEWLRKGMGERGVCASACPCVPALRDRSSPPAGRCAAPGGHRQCCGQDPCCRDGGRCQGPVPRGGFGAISASPRPAHRHRTAPTRRQCASPLCLSALGHPRHR